MDDFSKECIVDDQLFEKLETTHEACYFCNGFYESSFGEPVCSICHTFLYSETLRYKAVFGYSYISSDDDGDSGNDEPSEENVAPLVMQNVPVDRENAEREQNTASTSQLERSIVTSSSPTKDMPGPSSNNNLNKDDIPPDDGEDRASQEAGPFVTDNAEMYNVPYVSENSRLNEKLRKLSTPWPQRLSESVDISRKIPPEIWMTIFSKLDDVSLAMASKVSSNWKAIITSHYSNSKWKGYVMLRWPLFKPIYAVNDWFSVYMDFLDSLMCKRCFMDLLEDYPEVDPFNKSLREVRLKKEVKWLKMDRNPEGIEATPLDGANYNWLARITGPSQSPYQGGVFYLNVKVPSDYPLMPPIVRFLTRIFHPNISRHGDIGVDCIQHNWTLALTIPQILLSVQSLLTDPYLDISMEPRIARLYQDDRRKFDDIARNWTWKYAMHDVLYH